MIAKSMAHPCVFSFLFRTVYLLTLVTLVNLSLFATNSIVITSPGNGSNANQNTDLTVTVNYQSNGGGYQTPTWAYRIGSDFPGYGSPHGGTQVNGLHVANDFLNGQSDGTKQIHAALLDQSGNLHNPPVKVSVQVNYQSGGGGSQSGGGGNSIVITSPGNGSNANQNTDLTVTVNYQSNGGGYQTPTWAYRIGSSFPGYGSPHGGTQITGALTKADFLNGQSDGTKQVHATLLDQSGNILNPPVTANVHVNYQSGGGGNQSPGGDSITITSPGNQSSIYSHNDNLSVSITYQSGGGGNQTPMWAYRINTPFPGYGSPHGGTQVNGSLVANDFLANQALGSKVVSVTLLDQNGNLRNPPMNQTVVVYYQSQTGGHQSGGGGTHVSYTGPYQSPTGNFKTDTRNALFDDYVEFKGLFSVGKLKYDYNTSTYFNQSIDELGNQLTTLSVPPSTARGNSIDAWISQNFTQANSFDHHLTMQAFKLTAIGNVDLNKSSDIKNLAKNHNRIYFQVYNQSVIIDGVKQGSSIWALSIEGGVNNSSDLIVDMSGKVYNGDFNSYWYTVHGIETWNSSSWSETSYATNSAGIDSMLLAHPVIFDPKALVHTIKPFDFIPDGQADLANDKSLLPATVNYGKIYFQKYHFPHVATTTQSSAPMSGGNANAVSAVGAGLMNPLDIVAGQIRDQGYQSGSAGYQSSGGMYQTPASGAFMPYTGPYVSPSLDLRIDIRNALFDDFIENKNLNSITKLKNDYNTTKEFNDSVDALVSNLKTLPTPPSTSRGDAVDEWIKGGFEQVKNIDPKKETEFVWALSIEEPSHNGGNIVIDMHGNIYNNTDYESYWLSVYGVATHNDDNWTEVEYPTTVSGLVRLYQDYPFISPSVVMESKYKLAVLETNTPQVQGNVITLSGTIRDSHGTEILQSGFLVSSKGHPFMNDPASTVVSSSTITNTLTASYSAPTGGVYYVRSFAETKGGFSEGPVRKAEIISGAQSGNDPQAAALAIIKQGTTELAGGWRQSPWFGLFLDRGNGWVFHQIHGWLYLSSDGVNGLWVWHERRKWLWSTEGLYPHIYQSGPASWIYMLGVFNSKAIFFNYSTNQVEFE